MIVCWQLYDKSTKNRCFRSINETRKAIMRDKTQCTEPFSQSHPKLPSVHKQLLWISLISNTKKFPATWTWTPSMKSKASWCVGLISWWINLWEWMYSIQEIWLKVWENEWEYQIRSNEPADLQVEEQWTCDCRNWKDLWEKVQPFLLVSVQSFNESMILKPVLSLPKKRPNLNINQKSTKLLQVALVSLLSNGMQLQCYPHFFV